MRPLIRPRARPARRRSSAASSGCSSRDSPRPTATRASSSRARCRARVAAGNSLPARSFATLALTASTSASSPPSCRAETETIRQPLAVANTPACSRSGPRPRSALLSTRMSPARTAPFASTQAPSPAAPSTAHSRNAAESAQAWARRTPSCSISLRVRRRPAVSASSTLNPPITSGASITSRVVPGVAVTMAASRSINRFSRLDLPALGAPMMAIR